MQREKTDKRINCEHLTKGVQSLLLRTTKKCITSISKGEE